MKLPEKWRIKLIVIFFIFGFLNLSAQEQLVTINLRNATLKELFSTIEKQTTYRFAYRNVVIDNKKDITILLRDVDVSKVLKIAFEDRNLDYNIVSKTSIVVSDKKQSELTVDDNIDVHGTVVDDSGEPIIGANIIVKGATQGTISDVNGEFMMKAPKFGILQITYIGYETKEVNIAGNSFLRISIQENAKTLDEVVVVGYGTQKKINLTGAVSTISAKELNNRPVVSAANALQGADPAVNINFGTGSPESNYNIDIRGSVSINAGNPLILADGIEVSLKQINPNDIESVSILKDASATAIYGTKASAGVVLITTKRGGSATGKAIINYSGRYGLAQNTTSTDFITTGYDHVVLSNRFYNAYNGVDMFLYADEELQKLYDRRNDKTEQPERPWVEVGPDGKYYYYANFDWYGYYYNRTRAQQEHNITVNGGNDQFNYYVSGRYLNQEGVFRIYGDSFEDYSFRTKMSVKFNPWLRYSNNINFDKSEMQFPGQAGYEQTISALQANTSASFLPRNPDGTIVQYTNQLYANSPLGTGYSGAMTANNTKNSKITRYIILSNQLDFDLTKNLTLTALYGYRMRDPINRYRNNTFEYSRVLGETATFSSGAVANVYTENRYSETQSNTDVFATYSNTFNNEHNLTIVGGTQFLDYKYSTLQASQTNLVNESIASFQVATGNMTISQNINTLRTLGFFGRVNYDYNSKYLFEISARADGSSRFQPGSRWAFFPSASAGWRISEESFFEPLRSSWNNLKLRLSSGSLGNQQTSSYYEYIDQIQIVTMNDYTFDNDSKTNRTTVSNPISANLTWETVSTYNLGLDMAFLNNRLNLTTDLYIRDTKDMLIPTRTLPNVYGAATPRENAANLRTKGYEILVRWNDSFVLSGEKFNYGISATLGDYLTRITKFHNPDKLLSSHYEGKTLGEIWGYRVEGLFKTDEEAAEYQANIDDKAVNQRVYNSKGEVGNYLRAGDVKFMDLNDDKIISEGSGTVDDPGDREIIGNSLPRYSYSFRFDLAWKNFDISAFFQGVGKRDWYPSAGQSAFDFWGPYAFPSTSFIHVDFEKNNWTEENQDAYFPRQRGYQAYVGGSLAEINDRYLQNVSYLRFKNLTIGYTAPILKKYLEQVRFSITGENLWYWSPLKKYNKTVDPELAITSSTYNTNSGVGYFYSQTISINLGVTF